MVGNALMLFLPIPKACLWVGYTLTHTLYPQTSFTGLIPPHPTAPNHTHSRAPPHHTYPAPIPQLPPSPHTPPLRVDSDEMRQNRKVLVHEVLECSRASTKWTSTKWTSRVVANKARACSKSVCCERGRKRRWVRWEIRRVSSEPCRVCAKTP